MTVQALGYVGVRANNLEDWAAYGANFLGLQRIDKSRSSMAFRMDDRKQRLVVDADGGQGISFFGWEVADAAALDALAARLEAMGTKVARGSRALADERHVRDLIVTNDPYCGGTHLNDITVVTPAFQDGRLVGWAANRAHHADVGGAAPGSIPADATDIQQEGFRIPPTRYSDELHALLLDASRTPEERAGDLEAQLGANVVVARA